MNRALHWLRARMGVRVVSALAAAAAVAVVLVVAGVSLVLLLDHQLRQSTESAAQSQAEVLGQRIRANFTGTGDAKQNAIDATGKRGDIVQVLTDYGDDSDDPDGRVGSNGPQTDVQVIGSSDTLDSRPRLVDWLLAPRETRVVPSAEVTLADGSTEEVTIVGKGYRATGRPITVLAAQPLKPVHQAVDTVSVMVTVGIPILVLVTGFFTYLFAGRALRPVEAMRRRVAGLTDRDLDRRVPEPETQDEVGRLARTMNQMLSRLQDSQDTQRRFVADASHELRSPLATVSTGLELLGNGMGPGSADLATVQTLRGETGRLTKLVEGLLFLARADERGIAPRREEVDLDELVEGERVRPSADDRVSVTVTTEPVRVVGDRGQLIRVLRNLVDNALRHAETAVSVSLGTEDDLAVIDVDDDGAGIPDSDRTRVFERFVRLDEARARGEGGSGLGLAIVAELVSAHGGTVTAGAAGTLGGARFRVTLPLSGVPGSLEPVSDADTGPEHEPSASDDPQHGAETPAQTGRGPGAPAAAMPSSAPAGEGMAPAPTAAGMASAPAGEGMAPTPAAGGMVSAPAGEVPASTPAGDRRGSDLFSPAVSAASVDRTGSSAPEAGAPSSTPGGAGGPATGPVLFDDRPSGPLPRVPMGGRRRGPTPGPPSRNTADGPTEQPDEVADGAPAGIGAPTDGTQAGNDTGSGSGSRGDSDADQQESASPPPPELPTPRPSASPTPRPVAQPQPPPDPVPDPPTGPLPIRPNTVGSPADQNATRPLPLVRPAGEGRSGRGGTPARRNGPPARNGIPARNGPATRNGTTAGNGTAATPSAPANGASTPHGRNGAGPIGQGLPGPHGRRPDSRNQPQPDRPAENGRTQDGRTQDGHPQNGPPPNGHPRNGHPRNGSSGPTDS